jgi:arylsulfatase A-like enzyme
MSPAKLVQMISIVPNVLYLVWDDAGIATWNAFGGLIETPTMRWLAGRGLRYSQWHVPARSSPTRCSLLTGRNCHVSGGAGSGGDGPGRRDADVVVPPDALTLAEMLRAGGYRTYCVGKWHLSPAATPAMPHARGTWPLARGFDRYYGFLGGQASQLYPDLVFDDRSVDPTYTPAEGYHLARDLADVAIEFIRDGGRAAPGQPWLCYLSFGGNDPPHAVPREWAQAYRGRFEMGYDHYREIALGNAKGLGLVPEGTALAPADGNPARGGVPGGYLARPWHSLTEEEKRLSSQIAESYAGLCSYTDHQIGRLLSFLDESGQLDDTIVVACSANAMPPVEGDGAAREGAWAARDGAWAARDGAWAARDGAWAARDGAWAARDRCGPTGGGFLGGWPVSAVSAAHWGGGRLPAVWSWAFGTPYNVSRQQAVGGTAASPLIISWPREMADVAGGVRDQYHHAADVVATICDCTGIEPPQLRRGRLRAALHGVSMRYTFAAPDAPSARRTQLYQGPGGRAIYHDGWKAVATPGRWELYQVSADRAETRDLAAAYPAKVAELAALWQATAWNELGERGERARRRELSGSLGRPALRASSSPVAG